MEREIQAELTIITFEDGTQEIKGFFKIDGNPIPNTDTLVFEGNAHIGVVTEANGKYAKVTLTGKQSDE